ncbi:unnamed protein product [Brassica oleracea var. botrytis]|uniref:(rape) hypothetical protein n=1 Tax=Brassica napus TaxID=3708 RepID=A0A816JG33_BRANA|nr:unnamed protein product [Brassica napus]
MIFFGLGVWQTYVVVLYRRFSPTAISKAISKAIRRKPYRGRVPPLSSPVISPITTNLVSPSCRRVFS